MTADSLLKIFYSNLQLGADWQNLDEISWMISEDMILVTSLPPIKHQKFIRTLNKIKNSNTKLIRTGESISHMALKSEAANFLKEQFHLSDQDIRYEYPLVGFEVDVIDKNLNFPIECGDTSAIKLEKYLALPNTKKFFILPYPHFKDLTIYQFVSSPKFFEYLDFKHKHLNEKNAKLR